MGLDLGRGRPAAAPPSTATSCVARRPRVSATASRSRSSRPARPSSGGRAGARPASQPTASPERQTQEEQCDLHGHQGDGRGQTEPGPRSAVPLNPVSLTIGIVGLPNVGKSTLFNALTKNDVLAANYPFATIEPNVGVVGVPDPRLAELAEIFGSAKLLPGHGVVRRHRRHRARRVGGGGAGQQVPRQHPRERRDLPGDPRVPRPQRRARRRRGRRRRTTSRRSTPS